jgi:hypothetical protein
MTVDAPGYLARTGPVRSGVVRLEPDPDVADADSDGLSNGEEAALGTDAASEDSDDDGLDDAAETLVAGDLALAALGAKPLRRDMFVQYNWMRGRPSDAPTALMRAVLSQVFADSTLVNPDGSRGVFVHLDAGELGGGGAISPPEDLGCAGPFTPYGLVASNRAESFFHVFAAPVVQSCGFTGIAYGRRSVVVDTLPTQPAIIRDIYWAGSIAHELGHTLGLHHGGLEDLNCKPNYPSVMNYDNLPMLLNGRIGFSRGGGAPIDENAVDERAPLLVYGSYDIDHDGRIDSTTYPSNLTDGSWADPKVRGLYTSLSGVPWNGAVRCGDDGALTELRDHDDWSTIGAGLPLAVGDPIGVGPWDPFA